MKGFLLLTIFRLIRGRILFATLQRWQALPLFLMKFLVHKFSGNRWNCKGNNYSFGMFWVPIWWTMILGGTNNVFVLYALPGAVNRQHQLEQCLRSTPFVGEGRCNRGVADPSAGNGMVNFLKLGVWLLLSQFPQKKNARLGCFLDYTRFFVVYCISREILLETAGSMFHRSRSLNCEENRNECLYKRRNGARGFQTLVNLNLCSVHIPLQPPCCAICAAYCIWRFLATFEKKAQENT